VFYLAHAIHFDESIDSFDGINDPLQRIDGPFIGPSSTTIKSLISFVETNDGSMIETLIRNVVTLPSFVQQTMHQADQRLDD
tara:strand:+ start:282 stop:527 length:246 start_codon:yes stop_codon:yes gene_type:complete